ncbi:MAG: hypothetical protein N2C14_34115 [Planctomycetales bacterium]
MKSMLGRSAARPFWAACATTSDVSSAATVPMFLAILMFILFLFLFLGVGGGSRNAIV